mmetsp:Transcript_9644/g.15105  ORF Transcript_9644/g.15105 Transcript_9644/m.15105 type:complete len:226 (-) Transcript_9644:960-1637(-)
MLGRLVILSTLIPPALGFRPLSPQFLSSQTLSFCSSALNNRASLLGLLSTPSSLSTMDPKGNGVRGLSASAQPVRQVAELKTGLSMEYFSLTPAGAGTKTPLLFIHGSFHGGWCWAEHWLPYFADEGYPVYAVSLRGTTGSPQAEGVKSVKLQEHTEDLGAFISEVLPPGSEPVLVGHSFGGMYAQKVAESGKVPLKGLAMLCSVAPSVLMESQVQTANTPAITA